MNRDKKRLGKVQNISLKLDKNLKVSTESYKNNK